LLPGLSPQRNGRAKNHHYKKEHGARTIIFRFHVLKFKQLLIKK